MKKVKSVISITIMLALFVSLIPAQAVYAASPKLNKSKAIIYVGNTLKLKLKNAVSSQVKWTSSNKKIATVDNKGKVVAKKSGKTQIVAKYKTKKYKAIITVKSNKLNKKEVTLYKGSGYQLSFSKYEGKAKWRSSNSSVAKVNTNGYVTAIKEGSAIITATVKSEKYNCLVRCVSELTNQDFDYPVDDEGFTNYIDFVLAKSDSWYRYYDTSERPEENRGIMVGDTYSDVINAFGEQESVSVDNRDKYNEYFKNSNYPRTAVIYTYRENYVDYNKKFYFDGKNNLVLIIWYCD